MLIKKQTKGNLTDEKKKFTYNEDNDDNYFTAAEDRISI